MGIKIPRDPIDVPFSIRFRWWRQEMVWKMREVTGKFGKKKEVIFIKKNLENKDIK